MQYNKKKGQESRVKRDNFGFLPKNFPNSGIENATPPKQDVVLKVLTENKVFYVSKWAWHASTPCNNGLK